MTASDPSGRHGDNGLDALYLDLDWSLEGRPFSLAVGMVSSVDGAVTIDETSGALGGAADAVAFRRLRDAADVIIVGAGTVGAEDYGPPVVREDAAARRRAEGREPAARLAIVSNRASLDTRARVFQDLDRPPYVILPADTSPERVEALAAAGGRVLHAGLERVDLAEALSMLGELGHRRLLAEGGPALNGALLTAGLVDWLFLTVAPTIVGRSTKRIFDAELDVPADLELVSWHEHASELVLRYRVHS